MLDLQVLLIAVFHKGFCLKLIFMDSYHSWVHSGVKILINFFFFLIYSPSLPKSFDGALWPVSSLVLLSISNYFFSVVIDKEASSCPHPQILLLETQVPKIKIKHIFLSF